jgi:hypothetical protein
MSILKVFKRKPKVDNADDSRRLSVTLNERPLREIFREEHYRDVLKARDEWFNNTPQIWRKG